MGVKQIKGRTTSIFAEFDKYSLSSNSLIYTDALEEHIEEYSIELTVGNGWSDLYSDANKNLFKITDNVIVDANSSVVIEVAQKIVMPHNNYGVVLSTGGLFLAKGVLIATAKVEPSFSGKLKLRVFNTTKKRVTLNKGEKLGSVIFFKTESTVHHNPKNKEAEISVLPASKAKLFLRWLAENKSLWVSSLINVSLTMLITYFVFWKPTIEANKVQGSGVQLSSIGGKNDNN